MNLILHPNQFNPNHLYFLERKSNMIIDGFFSKLLYSTQYFITTGLFIDSLFHKQSIKKIGISLFELDLSKNKEVIKILVDIENQILSTYMQQFQITDKIPVYDLENKIQSGILKFYSSTIYNKSNTYKLSSHFDYYLKISGIWETEQQLGLTYKIIEYIVK